MVSTRRSSSRLTKKQRIEANVSDDNMEIDDTVVASSSHSPDVGTKDDIDDDFQAPLPMPTRSIRSKSKVKAKQEPSKTISPSSKRPKLEREASFLRGRIAEIKIENNTHYNKSFSNNSTSSSSSSSNSGSNETSPTSIDNTEYELDSSAVADSAVASPSLPSALVEFDSGSQQVSADEDEANLDLVLSNILASRRNINLHHDTDTEEESEAEIPLSSSSSSSSSEAEFTSEDDQPLANIVNNNRRRRGAQRQRQPREPYVSFFMQCTKIHAQHVFFFYINFVYCSTKRPKPKY
jgi:hypothetical protein